MSNAYKVAILEGDAIGPEIMAQAVRVFDAVTRHRDVEFELIRAPFGAAASVEDWLGAAATVVWGSIRPAIKNK